MTLQMIQTCNKCEKKRDLAVTSSGNGQVSANHQHGGWRPFGDKHVCPECLEAFVKELG